MKARLPDGYGKQSPKDLMRQAQEMQDKMAQKQTELEETEFTAKAGGGMVEVTMRGDYTVAAVKIDPDAIDPEDMEMLEDMVGAAFNEGVRIVKETTEKEMEGIQGSFNFNLPGLGL